MSDATKNPYVLRLEKLEKTSADQAARIEALERVIAGIAAVFGGAAVADDEELDGQWGDPVVKKNPTDRFWKGQGFVGKHLSECSPEFLDAYAKYKDVCAKLKEKDEDPKKRKYAEYDRTDAGRARGWARRLRAGWSAPAKPELSGLGAGASGLRGGGLSSLGGGGLGLGGSSLSAPTPAAPASSAPAISTPAAETDDDPIDTGTSFDFGANVAPPDAEIEEEEAPL